MSTEPNTSVVVAAVYVNYRSGRMETLRVRLNVLPEDMESDDPTLEELQEIVEASFEGGEEGFLTLDDETGKRTTVRLREVESISVAKLRPTTATTI